MPSILRRMDEPGFLGSAGRDLQIKVLVPPELSLADGAALEVVAKAVGLGCWQRWKLVVLAVCVDD